MSRAVPLTLRALMEAGIVAALAFWGYRTGSGTTSSVLLGVGAPAIGFGFWGAVDFRRAGRLAEPLRLVQELAVSLGSAFAVSTAGAHALGVALAAVSIAHHLLVYATGGRLLKPRPAAGARYGSSRVSSS